MADVSQIDISSTVYDIKDARAVAKAGDAMTGPLHLPASTASDAPLRIPHGSVPTAPVNGDMWTTNQMLAVQLNNGLLEVARQRQSAVTKTVDITDLQTEITAMPRWLVRDYTYNVNAGTYSGEINLAWFCGPGSITINGASSTTTTHNITRLIISSCTNSAITIKGFNVLTPDNTGITANNNNACNITLNNMSMVAGANSTAANVGISAICSTVTINDSALSNKAYVVVASVGAEIIVNNPSGTGNDVVYRAIAGAINVRALGTITGNVYTQPMQGGKIHLPEHLPVAWRGMGHIIFGSRDMDAWTTSGGYGCDGSAYTHAPPGGGFWQVWVYTNATRDNSTAAVAGDSILVRQVAFGHSDNSKSYERVLSNNGWSQWDSLSNKVDSTGNNIPKLLAGRRLIATFTSSGTFSIASYTNALGKTLAIGDLVDVYIVGGGAGGAGNANISGGGAGGGGGYCKLHRDIALSSASYAVTIGAGGAGGASGANPGIAGGTTSFGALSVAGGQGGNGSGYGGNGGSGGGGTIGTGVSGSANNSGGTFGSDGEGRDQSNSTNYGQGGGNTSYDPVNPYDGIAYGCGGGGGNGNGGGSGGNGSIMSGTPGANAPGRGGGGGAGGNARGGNGATGGGGGGGGAGGGNGGSGIVLVYA